LNLIEPLNKGYSTQRLNFYQTETLSKSTKIVRDCTTSERHGADAGGARRRDRPPRPAERAGVLGPRRPRLQALAPHPLRPRLTSPLPRVPPYAAAARLPPQPLSPPHGQDPSVRPHIHHLPFLPARTRLRLVVGTRLPPQPRSDPHGQP
jgi:hypothetical protein